MGKSYQDVIVSSIGEIGLSQVLLVIACKLGVAVVGFGMIMMSFIGLNPNWKKVASVGNITNNASSGCPINENETVIFDGNIHTIVTEWELICGKKWIPPIIITVQMAGVLAGLVVNGQMGDWFGRRRTLVINFSILLFFMMVQGFSVNWQMVAACMFFIGSAIGAYMSIVGVYFIEFIGTSWRTPISCIPAWPLGILLLGGAIKLFGNWRHVCFTGAVAGLPVLVSLWFCPESIRWLFVHGHINQGKDVIKRIAKRNRRDEPDLSGINELIEEIISSEKVHMATYNYFTLLKYKFTRMKVALLGIIWFSMAISYYVVMFGVGRLHGDITLNMMLTGLVQCFGVIAVWIVSKCLGRKYTSAIALLASSLSCFGITIAYFTTSGASFGRIQQGLAITSMFCMASSWRSVILQTLEVFPTVLRSIGFSTVSMFARIGGMIAPQIAALMQLSGHLPFTIIAVLALIATCCCLPLEDTYTTSLEDYLDEDREPVIKDQSEGNLLPEKC